MINAYLTSELRKILKDNNINPNEDYVPAYNGESAGLDLYNTSNKDYHISPSSQKTFLKKEKLLIPTGLKVKIPKGYVGIIQERGSITKTTLKVRAGVIDSGYTGEIFVNCVNIGDSSSTIYKNSKLPFQLVVLKCDNEYKVVDEQEYLSLTEQSSRKEGQVGSSD